MTRLERHYSLYQSLGTIARMEVGYCYCFEINRPYSLRHNVLLKIDIYINIYTSQFMNYQNVGLIINNP